MKFKSIIDSPCGLRFYFESIEFASSYARRLSLEKEMMTDRCDIYDRYKKLNVYKDFVENKVNAKLLSLIRHILSELKDVERTISKLFHNRVLDDIELFEIKNLSMLSLNILDLLQKANIDSSLSKEIEKVVDILDPDKLRIPSFYIYNSYSTELASIRKKIEKASSEAEQMDMLSESSILESVVRRRLSTELTPFAEMLMQTLQEIGEIDILLAQALLMDAKGYSIPSFSESHLISLNSFFNPSVKDAVEKNGGEYQMIDIEYGDGTTLIIGSNMGGKSVVLKSLALCQFLFQFGYPIPATSGKMVPFDSIFLIIGDGQNELRGLSSFAAEMNEINKVILSSKGDKMMIAFIDEPARSANPVEGTALVSALIHILKGSNVSLVITTHYNLQEPECNRLKVRGMEEGRMNYKLMVSPYGEVPHEALTIAESLNVSKIWIDEARKILNTNLKKK